MAQTSCTHERGLARRTAEPPSPEIAKALDRFSSEWPFVARVSGFPVSAPVGVPLCLRIAVVNATGETLRFAPGSRLSVDVVARHRNVSGPAKECRVAAEFRPCPDERCVQPTPGRWWTTQPVVLRCVPLVEGVVQLSAEVDTSHLRLLRAPRRQLDEAALLRRSPWLGPEWVDLELVSPDAGFTPDPALMGGPADAQHAVALLEDEPGSLSAAFALHIYLQGMLWRDLWPLRELARGKPSEFVALAVWAHPDARAPIWPVDAGAASIWQRERIRRVIDARHGLWFEGELRLVAAGQALVAGDFTEARRWLDTAARDPYPWVSELAELLLTRMKSQHWRMSVHHRRARFFLE